MASEWRRQLNGWLQEHMLAVSSVGIIISTFMFLIGTLGQWYAEETWAPAAILDFVGAWAIWILIAGVIALGFSSYHFWLVRHYMSRFEEIISTNSKKEFQKNWTEIEQIARYQLPKEYRKKVSEIREKFGLR
ncbi:MAG TPA: DUF3198 domain-containing protein [Candidatus Poseidoniia archaeon]|nr:DUF3198 domain-containing protein [Candidatus Poseidoniia archaeon]